MNVFGITGWKNSGKTTLVVNLVKELRSRGLTIATIKHAHHAFDIDQPGKDSFEHREAGAQQVLVASSARWALMRELSGETEPSLEQLLTKLDPVDLVLVEGFKHSTHPKLAVVRTANNRDKLPDTAQPLVAIASDTNLDPREYGCDGPLFHLDDVKAIADFIIKHSQSTTST